MVVYPRPQELFLDSIKMKQEKGPQEDVKNPIVKFYNIDIKNILKLTKKTSIIETNNSKKILIFK